MGSSVVVVSHAGDWINREEFFPHGECSFGAFARKRFRYIGMETDEEHGLHCHRNRYFSSALSRWISSDPIGAAGGLNLYHYCAGNPIVRIDPNGMFFWVVIAIAAIVLLKNHEPGGGREAFAAVALSAAAPAAVAGAVAGVGAGRNLV